MGGVSCHFRARFARLRQRVHAAWRRWRGVRETTDLPSFVVGTGGTPEEAAGGGTRRRREGDGGDGEGKEGEEYYLVCSSWFSLLPERDDALGPFPTAPVPLEARVEGLALEVEQSQQQQQQQPAVRVELKEEIQYASARIFATSLNCGGVTRLGELGCIEEWVPKDGYDL